MILGADIRFELQNRAASEDELSFLDGQGEMTQTVGLRSMTRLPDGSDQTLVEAKAVDPRYPLYGSLQTEPSLGFDALFSAKDGVYGVAVAPLLLDRLGVALGDKVLLGNAEFEIRAVIVSEPDALSDGFGFAPRLIFSRGGLAASGLIQVGSLVEYAYKLRLPPGTSDATIQQLRTAAESEFPAAGWSVRSRSNAAPALSANIVRFSQFLTLVGLTALIVGGVGVANAVRAYLDSKRSVIATFKCLGASGGFVFAVYLIQIMIITTIGIALGLVLGALMPIFAAVALAEVLPVSSELALYPGALAFAAVFGYLTALAFAILPLGRSRDVPATALFREQGFDAIGLPRTRYLVSAALMVAVLAAMAVFTSYDRFIASIFIGSIAFAFVILRLVSTLIEYLARARTGGEFNAAQAGHRQHPSSRIADAFRGAFAGAGPGAAGDACFDRRQPAARNPAAVCRSGRRTSFSSTCRAAKSTRSPTSFGNNRRTERLSAFPCCAAGSPSSMVSTSARSRCRRPASGCCAATAASPTPRTSPKTRS